MISAQNLKNTNYAILGLGRSGLSVAAALKASGAKVLCLDDNINNLKIAEDLGFTCTVADKINWNEIDVLFWLARCAASLSQASYCRFYSNRKWSGNR